MRYGSWVPFFCGWCGKCGKLPEKAMLRGSLFLERRNDRFRNQALHFMQIPNM